jgi:hypothetical protein
MYSLSLQNNTIVAGKVEIAAVVVNHTTDAKVDTSLPPKTVNLPEAKAAEDKPPAYVEPVTTKTTDEPKDVKDPPKPKGSYVVAITPDQLDKRGRISRMGGFSPAKILALEVGLHNAEALYEIRKDVAAVLQIAETNCAIMGATGDEHDAMANARAVVEALDKKLREFETA